MGDRIVFESNDLTEQILSAMYTTFKSFLSLKEILARASAILKDVNPADCDINLDPTEVTKDTLLSLFTTVATQRQSASLGNH